MSRVKNIEDSFDETEDGFDLTTVIAEFPYGDDNPGKQIPIKKLSVEFDGCVKSDEYMKVYLRIRPIKAKLESTISVESSTTITTNAPDNSKRAQYTKTEMRNYVFSKVYGPESKQKEVYESTCGNLMNRLMSGESSVLFAYGMTNAGKTFTIQGESMKAPGILPQLIGDLLESKTEAGTTKSISISMLEIYQEKIYDLLSTTREKLTIRDGNGKVEVGKLSNHAVTSTMDAIKLMDIAGAKRSKSTTCLNTVSSRSHAVFTVSLETEIVRTGEKTVSSFYLVDLAGAERGSRTRSTTLQQQEANSINVSLMKLWRCLGAMRKSKGSLDSNGSASDIQVPFRESKLTHLLMPILVRAGMGGVAMVTCVNPQVDDYDETISILNNASLAMKIKEIADLGRTASSSMILSTQSLDDRVSSSSSSSTGHTASSVARTISLDQNSHSHKDRQSGGNNGGKKRTRPDSGNYSKSGTLAGPVTKLSKKVSGKDIKFSDKDLEEINAVSATGVVVGTSTSNSMSTTAGNGNDTTTTNTNTTNSNSNSNSNSRAMEALQAELCRLQQENHSLINQTYARETEIRVEVALEMQVRSSHLLDQIQELRDEVSMYENPTMMSKQNLLQKSGKKMRKQRQDNHKDDADLALQEAEDELERFKYKYETEVSMLKKDKTSLEGELRRMQALVASTRAGLLTFSSSSSTSSSTSTELSKRFTALKENVGVSMSMSNMSKANVSNQGDMVLSPKKELGGGGGMGGGGGGGGGFGSRSPLQQITNSTSPKRESSVAAQSPMKFKEMFERAAAVVGPPASEGAGNQYMRRLRSQVVAGSGKQ